MDIGIFSELAKCDLFCKADRAILDAAFSMDCCFERLYKKGEIILSPFEKERFVIVILSGKAAAYSADTEKRLLLRNLNSGDLFGVANLFDSENFVTHIIAKSNCRVFAIGAPAISYLLENDAGFMYEYISFLSGKIRFLNKKIMFYTSGSSERRIALYLSSFGTDVITPDMPMNLLAELLDIGRASLYRGLDKLTEDGFIRRDGDSIIILDHQRMIKYFNL